MASTKRIESNKDYPVFHISSLFKSQTRQKLTLRKPERMIKGFELYRWI